MKFLHIANIAQIAIIQVVFAGKTPGNVIRKEKLMNQMETHIAPVPMGGMFVAIIDNYNKQLTIDI